MKFAIGNKVFRGNDTSTIFMITNVMRHFDFSGSFYNLYQLDYKDTWYFEEDLRLAEGIIQTSIDMEKYLSILETLEKTVSNLSDIISQKDNLMQNIGKENIFKALAYGNEEFAILYSEYQQLNNSCNFLSNQLKEMRNSIKEN